MGASGRGGVLESKSSLPLMERCTTEPQMTTHVDNLNPIHCFLWYRGLLVGRVAARVLLGASLCTLPLFVWLVS